MRIFSKIIFILNLCFLISAGFHYFQLFRTDSKFPQPLNFLKGSIVVLGEFAWIFNVIFFLFVLVFLSIRRPTGISKAMIIFNLLVLAFQVYYFQLYSIFNQ